MELFLVGGAVRDLQLGRKSKDWDFACVLPNGIICGDGFDPDPLDALEDIIGNGMGFEILAVTRDKFTIRARAPKGWDWGPTEIGTAPRVCDFVLARKEVWNGGDRQDFTVEVGTLADDLGRRDFTMNAIAMAADGTLIDPHGGIGAIREGVIRTVGWAKQRMREDGLRALRAVRFAVTLGFDLDPMLRLELSMRGTWHVTRPDIVVERRFEELLRCFRADTTRTLRLLSDLRMLEVIDRDGLWLRPTLEAP